MLEARIAETREKVAVISGDIASLRREKSLLFNELKNGMHTLISVELHSLTPHSFEIEEVASHSTF